jgi:predicted transcriptional regulator
MAKNKQISVLIDEEILAEVDADAKKLLRSRNWVINRRLENSRTLPPLWRLDAETGNVTEVAGGREVSKKIAGDLARGVDAEDRGTPGLSRQGKAQDMGFHGTLKNIESQMYQFIHSLNREELSVEHIGTGGLLRLTIGTTTLTINLALLDNQLDSTWQSATAKAGEAKRNTGRHPEAVSANDDVPKSSAVGDGKPKDGEVDSKKEELPKVQEVNAHDLIGKTVLPSLPKKVDMEALRDICAGNVPLKHPEPQEVDLCGFRSYNDTDGEWYVCCLEKHDIKTKHGGWVKE